MTCTFSRHPIGPPRAEDGWYYCECGEFSSTEKDAAESRRIRIHNKDGSTMDVVGSRDVKDAL